MNDNFTHIVLVLDRSGSMVSCQHGMTKAIQQFIDSQKKVPGRATISLALFDHRFDWHFRNRDLQDVHFYGFTPDGSTALYGAIGRAIDEVGVELAEMSEAQRPGSVLFVTVTDGGENNSHQNAWSMRYTLSGVNEKIKHQTEKYAWKFVFMGANEDAFLNADLLGIRRDSTMQYTSSNQGAQQAVETLCKGVTSYRGRSAEEKTSCGIFLPEEQDQTQVAPATKCAPATPASSILTPVPGAVMNAIVTTKVRKTRSRKSNS